MSKLRNQRNSSGSQPNHRPYGHLTAIKLIQVNSLRSLLKKKKKKSPQTYVKTKNKVVDPTRRVAAVDTGMYLVGLNLFPTLLGIL